MLRGVGRRKEPDDVEVKLGEDSGKEQPVRCGDEASRRLVLVTRRRRPAGGVELASGS